MKSSILDPTPLFLPCESRECVKAIARQLASRQVTPDYLHLEKLPEAGVWLPQAGSLVPVFPATDEGRGKEKVQKV